MEDERGPFDGILQSEPGPPQRDRAATLIIGIVIALGLLLLVLVLPPISIFDDGDGGGAPTGPVNSNLAGELPAAPPEGYEPVSQLFEIPADNAGSGSSLTALALSVSLPEGTPLTFFTYDDGEWTMIGEGEVAANGSASADIQPVPETVAVFREAGSAVQPDGGPSAHRVVGMLQVGAEPDPRAISSLSTLSITGYVPAADGSVIGEPFVAPEGVSADVVPVVTAFGEDAVAAVNEILASPELLSIHVDALLGFVDETETDGLEIDYRGMDQAYSGAFVDLVSRLSEALHADGRQLMLTLPLPEQGPEGWDELGFQWDELAPLADAIKLSDVPDQDLYYERMETVLGYLAPRVGASKLLLTVSPLSRERGVEGPRTMTLTEALSLASNATLGTEEPVAPSATVQATGSNLSPETGGSGLTWNEAAKAVAFQYTGPGGARTVWLANAFSEAFRLDLARRFQLGGVSVADASAQTGDANIWAAIERYGDAGEVELVKPNGGMLEPRWAASGGSLASETGATVAWQAPQEPGMYTLTLVVSDGITRVGQQLEVAVEAAGAVAP